MAEWKNLSQCCQLRLFGVVKCANGCSIEGADVPSSYGNSVMGGEGGTGGVTEDVSTELKSLECEVSASRFRVFPIWPSAMSNFCKSHPTRPSLNHPCGGSLGINYLILALPKVCIKRRCQKSANPVPAAFESPRTRGSHRSSKGLVEAAHVAHQRSHAAR
jgi:hypothetical protein